MAKDTIKKILEELDKVSGTIKKSSETGKFPDIEKDIVLSKLRNIYEFMNIIPPVFSIQEQKQIKSSATEDKKKIESIAHDIIDREPQDILNEPIARETTNSVQNQSPTIGTKPGKTEILAEKYNTPGNFMNEALARFVDTFDLSKKLQNQPISDISAVIGLNDKFLFIKELFNNDADLFNSTIDKLNKASNFNNAIQYIDSNFTWDFDNPSVQKLLELVRRRHPVSES